PLSSLFLLLNDTATTEIYTLSLHDALPICRYLRVHTHTHTHKPIYTHTHTRSEEHTSELQSHLNLVCRLLLEKKHAQHYYSSVGPHSVIHSVVAVRESVY